MSSPEVLDIEALLSPIAGENPSGESLRYAGTYDAIDTARKADDGMDRGEWKRETKTSDWRTVTRLTTEALTSKTKDLQIASWLVEAAVKEHGFAGLRDGLRLLRELHQRFWDSLYPEVEDGDLEFRASPLAWLNDRLPASVRAVPLVESAEGEAYSWLHWKESREVDNLARQNAEAHAEALAEGKVTGERFDKAVAAAPRSHYETLFADLSGTREEYEQLARVVDEHFGRGGPSLLGIKQAIEDYHTLIEGIVGKKRGLEPDPVMPSGNGAAQRSPISTSRDPGALAGRVRPAVAATGNLPLEPVDRADALDRLAAVAAYFRRTEPHSPVAYLVQRAVRWGEIPLEDWLREVIKEDTVLAQVRETLGLKDSE